MIKFASQCDKCGAKYIWPQSKLKNIVLAPQPTCMCDQYDKNEYNDDTIKKENKFIQGEKNENSK